MNNKSAKYVAVLNRPSALVAVGKFHFNNEDKNKLLKKLGKTTNRPAVAAFIMTAEQHIAEYQEIKKLEKQRQTAAESKKVLRRLGSTIRKLSTNLSEIPDQNWDAFSRLDLGIQASFCPIPPTQLTPSPWNPTWEVGFVSAPSPSASLFLSLLQRDLQALQVATQRALDLRNERSGPHIKSARVTLARRIADAFRDQLQEVPKTTGEGKFECVLKICFRAAGEYMGDSHSTVDLHALVMKVLKKV